MHINQEYIHVRNMDPKYEVFDCVGWACDE